MSTKHHFVRKYGDQPYNKFKPSDGIKLAEKVLGKHGEPFGAKIVPVGIAAVGQGDKDNSPYTQLAVGYIDNGKKKTIALVGKGVCIDTGGIHTKTAHGMDDMKFDKLGAINVLAVAKELIKLKRPKHNYIIITPFVANVISSTSYVSGDIIEYQVGDKKLRVEVENTDAEGRLILADGILQAQLMKADVIITVATLTGCLSYAVGNNVVGVFSSKDELAKAACNSFSHHNVKAWHLPIFEQHRRAIKARNTDMYDITNDGHRGDPAGASVAAAFLERFIHRKGTQLVHFDIASIAYRSSKAFTGLVKPITEFVIKLPS